jgi:hypothetical protein
MSSINRYREQVATALDAVSIRGPTQYAWLGRRSKRLSALVNGALDDAERRRYLVSSLREELYFSFYCHGGPVVARWGESQPVSSDPRLLELISQANSGQGTWEPGWTVRRVEAEEAIVSTSRLRVRIAVADCDGEVRPGAVVRVRLPTQLPFLSPGYWTILGDAPAPSLPAREVRVYWDITREGAPALVGALTSRLNGEAVPFRLKIADHPFRLDRCDAAVLYLEAGVFRQLRATLGEVATAMVAHLRPEIPVFTLELAPGVGLAEDDTGESFGVRRCALLADGIVRGHEQGLTGLGERIDAVATRFAEDGLTIDAPYRESFTAGEHVI